MPRSKNAARPDVKFHSLQTMEELVAPIPVESHKPSLEGKVENTTESAKRPAPKTGGCRIEGYVRVKKVNSPLK